MPSLPQGKVSSIQYLVSGILLVLSTFYILNSIFARPAFALESIESIDAEVAQPTQEPTPPKIDTGGIDFSDPELKKLALPAGSPIEDDKDKKDKSEGGCFWQKILVHNPEKCGEPSAFEKFFGFVKEKFVGTKGFLNFVKPARQPSFFVQEAGQSEKEAVETSVKSGTEYLIKSLYPAGFNPFRYTSPLPPTALRPQTQELATLFQNAAASQCVPEPVILAIARTEAGGTFSYSTSEVQKFSTPNWWTGASQQELTRGYCYDTCAQPGITCGSGANVMGAMQFELSTWNGLLPTVKSVLQTNYGLPESYEPNRCNLRDIIVAASIKLKVNSGTNPNQCTSWSEETIRNVALRYCGSCGTRGCTNPKNPPSSCSAACGTDYCQNVWSLSQSYPTRQ